jgi:hypothetical protein
LDEDKQQSKEATKWIHDDQKQISSSDKTERKKNPTGTCSTDVAATCETLTGL